MEVTSDEARKAMETLAQFGRQSYKPGVLYGIGEFIGTALAKLDIGGSALMEVAASGLEWDNHHGKSEIVTKLREGKFTQVGKVVTFTLD